MSLAERAVVDMSENAKYSQTKLLAVMNVPLKHFLFAQSSKIAHRTRFTRRSDNRENSRNR